MGWSLSHARRWTHILIVDDIFSLLFNAALFTRTTLLDVLLDREELGHVLKVHRSACLARVL